MNQIQILPQWSKIRSHRAWNNPMSNDLKIGKQHVDAFNQRKLVRSQEVKLFAVLLKANQLGSGLEATSTVSLALKQGKASSHAVRLVKKMGSQEDKRKKKVLGSISSKNWLPRMFGSETRKSTIMNQRRKSGSRKSVRSRVVKSWGVAPNIPGRCEVCRRKGHFFQFCPYLEFCPAGAEIGDVAAKVCFCCAEKECRRFPGGDRSGYCILRRCSICFNDDHWTTDCPKRKKHVLKSQNEDG